MTGKVQVKAFQWILPAKVPVTVIDTAFHLMGDANWDGIIDTADQTLFQAAFGSTPTSSNWNPNCDLNGDGKVDMLDLVVMAKNFGKMAPQYPAPFTASVAAGRVILVGALQGKTLKTDFKIADNASQMVIFEFNTLNGRVILAPSLLSGVAPALPGLSGLTYPNVPLGRRYREIVPTSQLHVVEFS